MKSRLLSPVYGCVFILGINGSIHAADYTFTKVIDTSDDIPGRTESFTRFDLPSLDGRDVAFAGDRNSDYSAVFTYIGGSFNLVADSTMPISGGVTNFDTLEIPIIDQGSVVFVGTQDSGYEAHGIYTDFGGSLRVVADHNTPIPGGTGNFGFFDDESHDFGNGVPAFTGWDSDFRDSPSTTKQGVYAEINGTLTVVADENTPHPDGGNFGAGGVAGVDGANVAFTGSNSVVEGLYLNSSGTISTIVDSNTLIPGSTDTFSFLAQEQMDVAEGTFVFVHVPDGDVGRSGIYSNVGGTLHLVAEIGDTTPDGIGSFTFFDNLAVDSDELAFNAGEDNGEGGIYRYFGGVLGEVITTDDMLDGKTPLDLFIHSAALDDNTIAFLARFDDGSSGIYLAEVSNIPIPPALWLFGSGLLGLIGITRRKNAAKQLQRYQ